MFEWKRSQKEPTERKTVKVAMGSQKAPEELKRRILDAMEQREQENARRQKKTKKPLMRAVSLAAAMVFGFGFTPLGSYVASAAEEIYDEWHAWIGDVFPVKVKKSKNDCTVEVVEARMSNEFLYLTMSEEIPDNSTVTYSGTVSDNKGNQIAFTNSNVCTYQHMRSSEEYDEFDFDSPVYADFADYQYRIYLPALKNLINSRNKKYTCELTANVTDESGKKRAKLPLKFNISPHKIDSVLQSTEVKLNHTVETEDLTFRFEKMQVSPVSSELFVELIPRGGFRFDAEFEMALSVACTERGGYHGSFSGNAWDSLYHLDGRHYAILNCDYIWDDGYDDFSGDDLALYITGLSYGGATEESWHTLDSLQGLSTDAFRPLFQHHEYVEIEDICVGEENSVLSVRDAVWDFERLRYSMVPDEEGEGYHVEIDGVYLTDKSTDRHIPSEDIDAVRLAAVKDGKTLYTVELHTYREIHDMYPGYWFTDGEWNVHIYDSEHCEVTYNEVKDLAYDHLVVAAMDENFYTEESLREETYHATDLYHFYNPKYCSRKECEKEWADYMAKIDALRIQ